MEQHSQIIELLNFNSHVMYCIEHHLHTFLLPTDKIPTNVVTLSVPGLDDISMAFGTELTAGNIEFVTESLASIGKYTGEDLKHIFMSQPEPEKLEIISFTAAIHKTEKAYPIYTLSDFAYDNSAVTFLKAHEILKESFTESLYVFFISKHIVIFIPDDGSKKNRWLANQMVKCYISDLEDPDFLSNHLYYYNINDASFQTLS